MRQMPLLAVAVSALSALLSAPAEASHPRRKARSEDAPPGVRAPAPVAPTKPLVGAAATSPDERLRAMEARIVHLEAELARRPLDISSYGLPEHVSLCGQPVRLTDADVRERLERELYLMLGDRDQVVLWTKRARRVFPTIDAEVKRTGACPDLRYLAVIESGLRPTVTSHASARGYWQFMAPTARDYSLEVADTFDERGDLAESTRAGVKYLRDLTAKFGGSWAMGMAAYNTGPGRLRAAVDTQGQNDYWHLDLVDEAERYVPRVIAAKIVMENLGAYGFDLSVDDGYPDELVDVVTLKIAAGRKLTALEAARTIGTDVRTFHRLNPVLADDSLPTGRTFALRVPAGRGIAAKRLADGQATVRAADAPIAQVPRPVPAAAPTPAPGPAPGSATASREHIVRRGDSLGSIAALHGVKVEDLRRWNQLSRKQPLHTGQKLVVER